jgi:hypothetical protein
VPTERVAPARQPLAEHARQASSAQASSAQASSAQASSARASSARASSAAADRARQSAQTAGQGRPRRSARRRLATERLFAELASLAAIPVDSYAVGEEVEGALCLLQTEEGFEVFHSADGNRHELQLFSSEESACFYLFGVLAAEAVRNGSLIPRAGQLPFARTTV